MFAPPPKIDPRLRPQHLSPPLQSSTRNPIPTFDTINDTLSLTPHTSPPLTTSLLPQSPNRNLKLHHPPPQIPPKTSSPTLPESEKSPSRSRGAQNTTFPAQRAGFDRPEWAVFGGVLEGCAEGLYGAFSRRGFGRVSEGFRRGCWSADHESFKASSVRWETTSLTPPSATTGQPCS
jgi:hypothetical protein